MRWLMRFSWVAVVAFALVGSSSMAWSAPNAQTGVDQYEGNNSFGTATLVPSAGITQATIVPRGDVDWYAFEVDGQGELEMVVSKVAPELDVVVRVWNANKDTITNWFAPLAKGGNTAAVIDLPAAGRYYLEVRDGSDDAESGQAYSLAIAFTPSPDQSEPNPNFGSAALLALGQPTQGTILPQGDADWYAVDVDHHGELKFAISNVPQELDVDVRVWNANRDTITNWFAPMAKGGNTEATVDLPAAGRYYLEVGDGSGDARSVKPYTIQVNFTAAADLYEPNGTFGSATALALGEVIQANILPAGDADWFAVDVPHHGELNVHVGEVAPELAISMRVWNANRDTITNWFSPLAKGGDTDVLVDVPAAGRYYLETVAESGQRAIRPFTVQASFTSAVDGLEPNNNFGRAAQFGATRSLQANILPAGDEDWLYFDVDHQGELGITIGDVAPEMAISVRVWNANKDTITNWFSPLAKGGDTQALVDLAAPGRYFLEVAAESGQRSIQPYTLETRFGATADQGEPNNTFETATPTQLDTTIAANILPAGDYNWYAFEVAAPGDLHILVTNVAPDLAITYRVWNSTKNTITNWFKPLAQGGNTEAVVPITEAGTYYLEVADNSGAARSLQPYLLRVSMEPIDPATMVPPALPSAQPSAPVTGTAPLTGTAEVSMTGKVVILTSGQVGPIGAKLFVDEPGKPELDGARLNVPPDSVDELHTVDIGATTAPPEAAPFGLQPAGQYWVFTPEGLDFKQPVSITLPVPTGAAGPKMFIGHWNGSEWEDLGGTVDDGLITAQTSGFSTYGVFCGSLADYQQVRLENASGSPTINILYVAGPSPDPDNPELEMVAGCPPSDPQPPAWEVQQGEQIPMLLRPGRYHFAVAYPQPQPGVTNSLWVTIPAGGGQQTIQIKDGGAITDDPNTTVDFPGKQVVEGSNLRPTLACNAVVPAGVTLANLDPAAAGLPSRVVLVGQMKLEQLPPKGEGINFTAVATDPEGSALSTYWTVTGAQGGTTAGEQTASGAAIEDQYTFETTTAGDYTVYLTVYDQFGLFDECRWILNVQPNNRPEITVVSGRTFVEFGRLDEERSAGVGPILPAAAPLRPGVAAPVAVPSLQSGSPAVAWSGLTLCPTAIAGPFAVVPDANTFISAPAPVDALMPAAGADATNRWEFPGRTCVWALVADADGDAQSVAWEFPGPIFGSGTFFAATEVPAGFDPALPDGITLGGFIRTAEQLAAYNAWVSALYNLAGVPPAIVWEGWDDPCPPGSGDVDNPCPTALSRGGVENIVANTNDGFAQPAETGYAPVAVGPEAFGAECNGVFFISSLTPVPSDPGPGQGVEVTARLSPLAEACVVNMSIVGTDGYSNAQAIPTNKSGESTLFIPGGAENVVDVVTASVCLPVLAGTNVAAGTACTTPGGAPGTLISMEVTYTF